MLNKKWGLILDCSSASLAVVSAGTAARFRSCSQTVSKVARKAPVATGPGQDTTLNNPTTTKQEVGSFGDALVVAGDDNTHYYEHNLVTLTGADVLAPLLVEGSAGALSIVVCGAVLSTVTVSAVAGPEVLPTASVAVAV